MSRAHQCHNPIGNLFLDNAEMSSYTAATPAFEEAGLWFGDKLPESLV